jgi:hypothetical protein
MPALFHLAAGFTVCLCGWLFRFRFFLLGLFRSPALLALFTLVRTRRFLRLRIGRALPAVIRHVPTRALKLNCRRSQLTLCFVAALRAFPRLARGKFVNSFKLMFAADTQVFV